MKKCQIIHCDYALYPVEFKCIGVSSMLDEVLDARS